MKKQAMKQNQLAPEHMAYMLIGNLMLGLLHERPLLKKQIYSMAREAISQAEQCGAFEAEFQTSVAEAIAEIEIEHS